MTYLAAARRPKRRPSTCAPSSSCISVESCQFSRNCAVNRRRQSHFASRSRWLTRARATCRACTRSRRATEKFTQQITTDNLRAAVDAQRTHDCARRGTYFSSGRQRLSVLWSRVAIGGEFGKTLGRIFSCSSPVFWDLWRSFHSCSWAAVPIPRQKGAQAAVEPIPPAPTRPARAALTPAQAALQARARATPRETTRLPVKQWAVRTTWRARPAKAE